MTTFTTPLNQVSSLYVGYLGRAGDPKGESYWIGQLNSGAVTLAGIAASFAVQPEAIAKYPYLGAPNITDPTSFVQSVYQQLFNRTPAAADAGVQFWVGQLNAAKGAPAAVGTMILNIISGATGTDSTTVSNRVDVASDFTTRAANAGIAWNNTAAAQSSTEISSVNNTAASVTAARAQTEVFIASAASSRQDFTLKVDTLTSSAQNATFIAPLEFVQAIGLQNQTLQFGDSAVDTAPYGAIGNGGTFTAILNSGAFTTLVTLQGIPTHSVTSTAAGSGYGGSSTGITGLVTLNNNNSTGTLTIGAAGAGVDKGGVAAATTTAATLLSTVNLNNVGPGGTTTVFVNTAALAGAADVLGINVTGPFGSKAAANLVSVKNDTAVAAAAANTYETLNIKADSATFALLSDGASGQLSTTKIALTGAGATSLGAAAGENFKSVTTIDASIQTGGVTITGANSALSAGVGLLAGNTVLNSFKGGSGADSLDISSMTAAKVQAITATNLDGGRGTARDTLILASAAATSTVALNNSNFEIVGITGLTGTVDFSKYGAGVDTFQLTTAQAAAATFNNLTSNLTVTFGANHGAFVDTFNSAGAALTDVFNLTMTGTAAAPTLVFTGFETINTTVTAAAAPVGQVFAAVTSTLSAGGTTIFNLIDNNGAAAVAVAGATNIGVGQLHISGTGTGSVTLAGALTAGSLNASGLNTGAAATTVGVVMGTAAAGQISILGSAGADTFIGSAAADTINGGAGNDVLTNLAAGAGGVGVFDQMTGGAGNDNFITRGSIAGAGALPASYSAVTNISDFAVGGAVGSTDFITLSETFANYATVTKAFQGTAAVAQGAWGVQRLTNGAGTVGILSNAAAAGATLLKFTTGVAVGATIQATFNSAIGTTVVTGITKSKSYFFTMYDTTNSRMDIGVVTDTTNTKINTGDVVSLVASVNMSATDYASITANHFVLISF